MQLHFPEFPSLHSSRLVWAAGGIRKDVEGGSEAAAIFSEARCRTWGNAASHTQCCFSAEPPGGVGAAAGPQRPQHSRSCWLLLQLLWVLGQELVKRHDIEPQLHQKTLHHQGLKAGRHWQEVQSILVGYSSSIPCCPTSHPSAPLKCLHCCLQNEASDTEEIISHRLFSFYDCIRSNL